MRKEEAIEILEQTKLELEKQKKNIDFIKHSYLVGNAAGVIAEKLGLDKEKAIVLGYIHDIGKKIESSENHEDKGYKYIVKLGYPKEYAEICIMHSYLNNDPLCVAGGIVEMSNEKEQFIKEYKSTMYNRIISLCDLMCYTKQTTLEKRIIEIISRKGVHENTEYHILEALKLKKHIEEKLGCSIYSLFENIEI